MRPSEAILASTPGRSYDWTRSRVLVPALLILGAVLVLPLDFVVGRWAAAGECPGFFRELFEAVEPFGNGNGVFYIVLALLALDWGRRRTIPRILVTAFGAGLAADVVKLFVERTRPCAYVFDGTIWDTFGRFFPLTGAGSGGQSFPSAHTALAVGLAAALAWNYPRARWFFFTVAAVVGIQRVTGGAHYLSDAFFGAAVGWVVAIFTLHTGRLAARLDRFEAEGEGDSEQVATGEQRKQAA